MVDVHILTACGHRASGVGCQYFPLRMAQHRAEPWWREGCVARSIRQAARTTGSVSHATRSALATCWKPWGSGGCIALSATGTHMHACMHACAPPTCPPEKLTINVDLQQRHAHIKYPLANLRFRGAHVPRFSMKAQPADMHMPHALCSGYPCMHICTCHMHVQPCHALATRSTPCLHMHVPHVCASAAHVD